MSCLTTTPSTANTNNDKRKIVSEHYVQMSGTSMSTPVVAGAIALLLQKSPKLTPDEVKLLIKQTATDLNYPPNQQGWGLLNIEKLLGEDAIHVR